jgi:hypothetical protein
MRVRVVELLLDEGVVLLGLFFFNFASAVGIHARLVPGLAWDSLV